MTKLKIAMISFDHIHADMRMKALLEQPEDVEIVAISEKDEARGRASQKKYGGEFYQDYRKLLERKDIDFVFIHSATSEHKQMVLDTAAAGFDLFCEKPLAVSYDEAKEMLTAVEKAGVRHMTGFNSRLIPEAERAKAIFDTGVLGKIVSVRSFLSSIGPKELGCPPYMCDWILDANKAAGGSLIDEGVHAIDLMRWFLGDIESVFSMTAKTVKTGLDVEDNAITMLRFKNGALGELNTSWSIAIDVGMKNTMEFYGSEGTLIIELTSKAPKVALYSEKATANPKLGGWIEAQIKPDSSDPHDYTSWPTHAIHFKREITDLIRRLKKDIPFDITFADGVKVAEVTSAAYASAAKGEMVKLK
jgi:predicted dehydrogenase